MKNKLKLKLLSFALLAAPLSIAGGVIASSPAAYLQTMGAYAQTTAEYVQEWSDPNLAKSLLSLPSFEITGISQKNNLDHWELIDGFSTQSNGMIIDISSSYFNSEKDEHCLTINPGKLKENYNNGKETDNKILMINSINKKPTSKDKPQSPAKRGYRSDEFTLEANSYYKIAIDAKTSLDGRTDAVGAYGSIYLSGLKDDDGKDVNLAFEGFCGEWTTYYFFIATGNTAQKVTLDLYLGASSKSPSHGVAFFDDINIERYSQNAFVRTCKQYNYNFEDTNNVSGGTVKFLVDALASSKNDLMSKEAYKNENSNFNFEKKIEDNGLTKEWKIITNSSTSHAVIYDVQSSGKTDFERTGYPFAGNDFSYDMQNRKPNGQALALYTDIGKSGKIVVENTTPILVEAHSVYKINMKVKVSQMQSESAFYVNLVEDGQILWSYNGLDESNTPLHAPEKSNGISSNNDSPTTNNYNDLTFYVTGRDDYDSQVKLQLCLGDENTSASGCVFVDNITIDYATTEETTDAKNHLDLSEGDEDEYPDIQNAFFNDAEVTKKGDIYPLTAKNWTLTQQEDAKDMYAGVVYLQNNEKYNSMYKNNEAYPWATSYPGSPFNTDSPNNVYMLYNGQMGYQSIRSEDYSLDAGAYYALNFDYFNLDVNPAKNAQLTVELVDENGIVLFKQLIENSHNAWNKNKPVNINIHTSDQTSHKVAIIIHFGTEDNPMIGTTYLDNISLETSSQSSFDKALLKVDLSDYLLNLDPEKTIGKGINSTTAYSFTVDEGSADSAEGGVISGLENQHNVTYSDKNGNAKNILVISSKNSPNTSTITSNFPFSLTKGQYYKLTFSFQTKIQKRYDADESKFEEGHTCSYGINIGLTNFELATGLKSDEEWCEDYSIYFEASESSESKLKFTLAMDEHYEGSAFLANLSFEPIDSDEYDAALNSEKENAFIAKYTAPIDSSDESTTPEEKEPAEFDSSNWIIIPSLITALAVVIGLIGWALKHVKIKKIEKIKQEGYDRKVSLNQDAILAQASKEREKQVDEIKANIQTMEDEKKLLEEEHKDYIKKSRLNSKGKITKETERQFKSYASRITRLEQKIEILNEQLEKVQSTEYLLSLQKQIASDETKRQKEALKADQDKK